MKTWHGKYYTSTLLGGGHASIIGDHGDQEIAGSCQLSFSRFDHVDNSFANCVSPTGSNQCRLMAQQRPCHVLYRLSDYACKRSLAICRISRHCIPSSFCPSLCNLHMLNRDVNTIQTKSKLWNMSRIQALYLCHTAVSATCFWISIQSTVK